ncbi:putative alpha-N-acetylgalactosaminide alpha-2,6-sialyltransferase 3-like isoform X3 [Apostichopus japonicus]|uniref:Putative alpha-N-acetylgalactosaminide alpha-2,6-sialyltransferase 3-like isoform X3 n=1 Tax=Stichopus japonicus TaxID=307972 RepID=A0A2G8JIZ7_STIJA|nr:putative alpha-N-acetylgalactosaminide alpha-2,6-sialyltransferase 3-like isoform X3 [Apostichopus japonicus]
MPRAGFLEKTSVQDEPPNDRISSRAKCLEEQGRPPDGFRETQVPGDVGPDREMASNGTVKGYNHLKALAMMLEQQGTECFLLKAEEMAYNNRLYEAETGQNSSSHILHSGAGPAIDADRQCVFRMNTAPTLQFENDVGARTTVRVLAHASVSPLFKSQKSLLGHPNATKYLIAWGPHQFMKEGGLSYRRLKGLAKNYPKVDFYVASHDEMEYADLLFEKETGRSRAKSGSWLTTGWFTMILARSVCSEIHVYGMVGENYCKKEQGRKHPYHYYNLHSQDECEYYRLMERSFNGGHRFMTEKAIFASWAKLSPKIYFHQPEWD